MSKDSLFFTHINNIYFESRNMTILTRQHTKNIYCGVIPAIYYSNGSGINDSMMESNISNDILYPSSK